MQKLSTSFIFHPIGQGCFYSGRIVGENVDYKYKPFNFVYDCGREYGGEILASQINEFKSDIDDVIDLIIISHFDMDHVNGIEYLLENTRCRRLVIPYCNPIERLFLLASYSDADDNYCKLLKNPIAYFGDDRFRIDEIIIVGSPEFENFNESGSEQSTNNPMQEIDEGRFGFIDYFNHEDSIRVIGSLPENEIVKSRKNFSIKFYQIPYRFSIGINDWQFIFYHKKGYRHDFIYRFSHEIMSLIRPDKSIEVLFDPDGINRIKHLYHDIIGGDTNSTSLITFHSKFIEKYNQPEYLITTSTGVNNHSNNFGTLLTGDTELDGPVKVKRLKEYYKKYFGDIKFFQIPHHGSIHNWKINNSVSDLYNFPYYVINYGTNNSYGHCDQRIIDDIKDKNDIARIYKVTECQNCAYWFNFIDIAKVPVNFTPLKIERLKK